MAAPKIELRNKNWQPFEIGHYRLFLFSELRDTAVDFHSKSAGQLQNNNGTIIKVRHGNKAKHMVSLSIKLIYRL